MDEISLNDKKHLNLFIDYINWKKNKNKVQKLFTHPKGQYEFVKNTISNGVFNINKNQTSSGIILIEDFNHNKVRIELSFIGKEEAISKAKKIDESKKLILPENEYLFDLENIKIKFHKNTFYNSSAISIEKHNETLHLGEDIYPINKSIEIFFDTNHINTTQKNKMFIGRLSKKNKPIFLSTKKAENIWSVKTDQLGKYALAIDTIPPSIKPINFKKNQWVSKQNFLKLKVTDNLSGIKSIKPSINGEWILMEYEPKNNTINYNFSDKKFPDGKHELEIILKDNLDNENVYNIIFYRKYM
ncbi:MAG: hypothetical protein CMC79_05465 [Flavobacteriaceae bacterium]|nr:hypothetical protein [Flavobacteriaceae bacterium]